MNRVGKSSRAFDRRGLRRAACVAIAVLMLAGCGGGVLRKPVPGPLVDAVQPLGEPGLRESGDTLRPDEVDAIIARQAPLLQARYGADIAAGRTPTLHFLALSGGGQWGAFGAGVL